MNKTHAFITASALSLALAACGGSEDKSEAPAQPAPEAAAPAEDSMKAAATEVVEAVKEALKLDTSSPEAFKASLAAMKDSLSDADKDKLSSALASLGKKAMGDTKEGGLMDKVKDVVKSGSVEDAVLKSFGDEIDGMTFEDLMDYAG